MVLEAQPKSGEGPVEISQLRRLLEHMPGVEPVALHSAERVAVQVHIDAPCEVEALRVALADLRAGLPRVGLWDLRVIRAEGADPGGVREGLPNGRRGLRGGESRGDGSTPTTPAAPPMTCSAGPSSIR